MTIQRRDPLGDPTGQLRPGRGGGLRVLPEPRDVLADAVLLLRASSIDSGTFTPGDDWPNEGTGGSSLDAVCNQMVQGIGAGTPVLATSPEQGFEFGDGSSGSGGGPVYFVPYSALLAPGSGSFTALARILWSGTSGGFDAIAFQFAGALGAGGNGWGLADSVFLGGTAGVAASGGSSPGTDPAFAYSGAVMDAGEHLVVARLDRSDGTLAVFVDGVKGTSVSAAGIGSVTAGAALIFGNAHEQTGRDYAYWPRALDDDEITVDIPAALL